MWKTVLRRVLIMIPQLIILSIFIFILAKAMPGDPFTGSITPQTDPAQLAALRAAAGLNDPWYTQYISWVVKMLHGDLGTSYAFKRSVSGLIGERAMNTFWLALMGLILGYGISVPLGVIAGRYEGKLRDNIIQIYGYITMSIPSFVFYIFGLYIFGYTLNWFPTNGTVSLGTTPGTFSYVLDRLHHMILPAILSAMLGTVSVVQYLRSQIVEQKVQDYVRTARAKGVPENVVFNRHILRNSFLPIAASLGNSILGLLGGSVFIETIFAYPGMGQLFIQSINGRDYSVITALIMLYGILTLLGNLLSDIIMSIVDPRIRIQ